MLDLIIFIKSDGANSLEGGFIETIRSIESTTSDVNYKYYFVLNDNRMKTVSKITKTGLLSEDKILNIKRSTDSWAYEYNLFLDSCRDLTKYILVSHDDIKIRSDDWFNMTMKLIKGKEDKIGWITPTSDFYYHLKGIAIGQSGRCGFAPDRNKFPYVFECHNFDSSNRNKVRSNSHLLDFPKWNKLVKIHATMSSFIMISSPAMKKIGYCEDWAPYTVFVDEDFGLEARRHNLSNIWIANIFYTHPNNYDERRASTRWEKEAHDGFSKKWGFTTVKGEPSDEKIKEIQEEYKNTLIPWSSHYNTYDWQYL